ncbi:hypothetical protein BUE93_21325, partial [Chromobacterium amazonense]
LGINSLAVALRARVRNEQSDERARLYLLSAGSAFVMPGLAIKLSAAALAPGEIVVLGAPVVD